MRILEFKNSLKVKTFLKKEEITVYQAFFRNVFKYYPIFSSKFRIFK